MKAFCGQCAGQASIEFLLVFSAALAIVSVSLHLCSQLEADSRFLLCVQSAESFVSRLESASSLLSVLGEGSVQEISSQTNCGWEVSNVQGKTMLHIIAGNREKEFDLPLSVAFPAKRFSERILLVLSKSGGKIIAIERTA